MCRDSGHGTGSRMNDGLPATAASMSAVLYEEITTSLARIQSRTVSRAVMDMRGAGPRRPPPPGSGTAWAMSMGGGGRSARRPTAAQGRRTSASRPRTTWSRLRASQPPAPQAVRSGSAPRASHRRRTPSCSSREGTPSGERVQAMLRGDLRSGLEVPSIRLLIQRVCGLSADEDVRLGDAGRPQEVRVRVAPCVVDDVAHGELAARRLRGGDPRIESCSQVRLKNVAVLHRMR